MEIQGPGIWYILHSQALELARQGPAFWLLLNRIVSTLPCMKCRRSAAAYLLDHPITHEDAERCDYLGVPVGLFRWTVDFHNWVNRETGKEEMDWFDALAMYRHFIEGEGSCGACT